MVFQLNVTENRWGRVGLVLWTPTAFHLNIFRTIDNRAKCFCISNDIHCVINIHNRIAYTGLVDYLNDSNQYCSIFLKNAQLLHREE